MADLNAAFQSLPDSIRNWLADETVALAIDEINQKYKFNEENRKDYVIPHLVLRLCVQDLEPRYFIPELSHWLDISFDSAKTLTQEIEDKILKPIAESLKTDVGIDLKLLYFTNAGLRPTFSRPEPESVSRPVEVKQETKSLSDTPPPKPLVEAPIVPPPTQLKMPPPTKSIEKKEELPAQPFILHEEKDFHPAAENAKPSFSYKVPINQRPPQPPPPAKVQIVTPAVTRVVHYSNFLTRLINKPTAKAEQKPVVKIPKSRWFI